MRCTASGQVRTWLGKAWSGLDVAAVQCPDCGLVASHDALVFVRATDLAPRAKTRAHRAPPGVTPSPYGVLPRGGQSAEAAS